MGTTEASGEVLKAATTAVATDEASDEVIQRKDAPMFEPASGPGRRLARDATRHKWHTGPEWVCT